MYRTAALRTALTCVAILHVCALLGSDGSQDWPQFRGPNRDGIAADSPKLLDMWPKDGPPLLWKSTWIPGCEEGGCSSPILAGGKVYVYSNAKVPIEAGEPYRFLTDEVLADSGWMPNLSEALAKKVEEAWQSEKRPASGFTWWDAKQSNKQGGLDEFLSKKPELDKYIKDFIAMLTPDEVKQYGAFVKRRLCIDKPVKKWGIPDGLSWEALTKLNALREKRLPYFRAWLRELEKVGANCWYVSQFWKHLYTWSDTVVCLDAQSGQEVWRKVFPVDPSNLKEPGAVQWWCFDGIGVSATPAVWKDKLYVVGAMGLYCLSTKDGTKLWHVPGSPEHASPLVFDGLVYHVGCAYNAETGQVAWKNPLWDGKHKRYEWTARYFSPVLMTFDGKHYVLSSDYKEESNSSFCCLDGQTGKVMWSFKSPIGGMLNAASDLLIVPPSYGGGGTKAYKISAAAAEQVWKQSLPGGAGHIYQDHLYIPSTIYHCVDLATGAFNWKQSMRGGVSECSTTVLADGKIFTPRGESHQLTKNFGDLTYSLSMVQASPERYAELGTFNPKMCMMTAPAFSGGKLFLRTLDGISCYDLRDHGVYVESTTATKDYVTFRFAQTGGGLVAKDASAGIQITDAAGTRPASVRITGDEVTVDIRETKGPIGIAFSGGGALAGSNGKPAPAFGWDEPRQITFRKCFDQTILLASERPFQQDGRWSKPDDYAIVGAKVTHVDLDPQGKGVRLITDKTWKVGETLTLSYTPFPVAKGEPRRTTLTATVAYPQRAAATFVKVDEKTSGDWKGVYGSEGAVICADKAGAQPACAIVTPVNKDDQIPWAPNAADKRYLVKSGDQKDRTVSFWAAPEQIEVNVEITDGKEHQVALYCLSWNSHCDQTVEVIDADTKKTLDTQPMKDFVPGKYLIWNVKGQVIIRISSNKQQEGTSALASGVFIDPVGNVSK